MVNRYVLRGIAEDLESAANIAVFIPPYTQWTVVLSQLTPYIDEYYTRIEYGNRKVEHESGGVVRFLESDERTSLRGLALDVVVIPHGSAFEMVGFHAPGAEIIEY